MRILVLVLVLIPAPVLSGAPVSAYAGHARDCGGLHPTIVGTNRSEALRGTAGDDVILGRGGRDVIRGLKGDDILCGGKSGDVLEGGRGDDRLYGGRDGKDPSYREDFCLRGDRLDGGDGDDLLNPVRDARRRLEFPAECEGRREQVRFALGHGGVRVDLVQERATGQGRDAIVVDQQLLVVGSDAHDVLLGTSRGETFIGRGGDDVFRARGGPDLAYEPLALDADDDRYLLGAGRDQAALKGGQDVVRAGRSRDFLYLESLGVLDIEVGRGNDSVTRVDPADGDRVLGGPGRDLLQLIPPDGSSGADLDAGRGLFTLESSVAEVPGFEIWWFTAVTPLTFHGTEGADEVQARYSKLTAYLFGGDDVITGGFGTDDYVDGGDGTDEADLLTGENTCVGVENGPC